MSLSECRSFEKKLANYTAPALLGIKCASLLSLSADEFDIIGQVNRFNEKANSRGMMIRVLCSCKSRVLILVYNYDKLKKRLCSSECREVLCKYGYAPQPDVDNDLQRLSSRISTDDFPHEIGVFLDYPIEDVLGFIENKGTNFKLCGFWKVYGDEEFAKRTFSNYDKCRKYLCNKLNMGYNIYHALKIS